MIRVQPAKCGQGTTIVCISVPGKAALLYKCLSYIHKSSPRILCFTHKSKLYRSDDVLLHNFVVHKNLARGRLYLNRGQTVLHIANFASLYMNEYLATHIIVET